MSSIHLWRLHCEKLTSCSRSLSLTPELRLLLRPTLEDSISVDCSMQCQSQLLSPHDEEQLHTKHEALMALYVTSDRKQSNYIYPQPVLWAFYNLVVIFTISTKKLNKKITLKNENKKGILNITMIFSGQLFWDIITNCLQIYTKNTLLKRKRKRRRKSRKRDQNTQKRLKGTLFN